MIHAHQALLFLVFTQQTCLYKVPMGAVLVFRDLRATKGNVCVGRILGFGGKTTL
ncbi:hypothetical protein HHE02_13760 [Helicobacter heilmannii]|uniref:Uncharacterized protein n=1 Tax=Helicobacter heilmannii TaxID=35817 RepID=A0A0K2YA14_HELHE|nr:hypothetical protein HHE02_13760 [Helicobacter heilmannii]CRF50089.1 hypothetical protein HHE03_17880 [Helicobacter heilmannii]CRI33795.1 hypothetical protein HHE01_14810 [Helicobacter heilmannii]